MAKPFSALPGILRSRHRQFIDGVDALARKAGAAAGEAAARHTRVDTGTARSNWQAAENSPSTSVIPPHAPGSKLGIGEQANLSGVLSQHRSALAAWSASGGSIFYIANNTPYIGILNFGGPYVSPGNMLALARQAWVTSIKTNARILR